jgi:hypothetical protein
MPKAFDASLKHLIEAYPADWVRCAGVQPKGPVRAIDADVSAVTAGADKVLHVAEAAPWLLHLEVQASRDAQLPDRMLEYNVLLKRRHKIPVRSLVVLLRPAADGPELAGTLEHKHASGQIYSRFGYDVLRVWENSPEVFLAGDPGLLPLAPLANVTENQLPQLAKQIGRRLAKLSSPADRAELATATRLLLGLRSLKQPAIRLLGGLMTIKGLEESTTYQEIVEVGKISALREALLRLGQIRFGPPSRAVRKAINTTEELARLEHLMDRVVQVEGWDELLA